MAFCLKHNVLNISIIIRNYRFFYGCLTYVKNILYLYYIVVYERKKQRVFLTIQCLVQSEIPNLCVLHILCRYAKLCVIYY